MKRKHLAIAALAVGLVAAGATLSLGAGKPAVTAMAKAELKWKEMGVPGVMAAPVSGDMDKGPSRFFLKYPVGLVTPLHHHSADHYVTLISGMVTLNAGGKDYKLGPGSYFELTGMMPHTAKVEGKEEAVFFIQADGPWDVVMEEKK